MNRDEYARDLLELAGLPITVATLTAACCWMQMESGDTGVSGDFNPLNTEQDWPGATDFNSAGVKNYPTLADGLRATNEALQLDFYTNLRAAFADGASALRIAQAIDASPWGTHGVAECVATSSAEAVARYGTILVSGTTPGENPPVPWDPDPEPAAPAAPTTVTAPPPEPPAEPAAVFVSVGVPEIAAGRRLEGEAVGAVQVILNARLHGAVTLKVDNLYGPATDAAVKLYQTRAGIAVDGIVGPVTWTHLLNG